MAVVLGIGTPVPDPPITIITSAFIPFPGAPTGGAGVIVVLVVVVVVVAFVVRCAYNSSICIRSNVQKISKIPETENVNA